jgi:hypothetical protein
MLIALPGYTLRMGKVSVLDRLHTLHFDSSDRLTHPTVNDHTRLPYTAQR